MFRNLRLYLNYSLIICILACYLLPNTEYLFGFDILLNHHQIELPDSFNGSLLANNLLSSADHLHVNEIGGPESFVKWNGKIYTSLADGRIIELLEDGFRTVAFLNPDNNDLEQCRKTFFAAKHCARPLGIRFSSNGTLYAIDPYHGIYQINVDSGQYKLVMDITKHLLPDGSSARFLDDLTLVEDDQDDLTIFMTDASQKWLLHDVFYTVGEHDQTGRLLSYKIGSNQLKIEIDHLAFPNGLALMDNKSVILMNEFNKRRILAYHIKGTNGGDLNVLIDRLPGEPDNIKRSLNSQEETYWIGLFTGRNKHRPSFFLDTMARHPIHKRSYFRLMRLVGFIIESIGNLFGCDLISQFGFDIRVANCMFNMVSEYGLAIEINSNGQIIDSLHSPDSRTSQLSEVFEYDSNENERYFYLGSYSNRYLGRLVVKRNKKTNYSSNVQNSEKYSSKVVQESKPKVIESKINGDKDENKKITKESTMNQKHNHQEL